MARRRTLEQRIAGMSRPLDNGCVEWLGCLTRGYGRINVAGVLENAHRVAYEVARGPIPSGKQLDHLCRNRRCVNVAHLEPVSCRENLLRGETNAAHNAAKSACERAGHQLVGANLYVSPKGSRECRACRAAAVRRFRMNQRQNRRVAQEV